MEWKPVRVPKTRLDSFSAVGSRSRSKTRIKHPEPLGLIARPLTLEQPLVLLNYNTRSHLRQRQSRAQSPRQFGVWGKLLTERTNGMSSIL